MKTPIKDFISRHSWYYVNSSLTDANFPAPKKVQTEGATLVPLTKWMSSEEVLELVKGKGLRPATVHELMAYFDEHKDELKGTGRYYPAFGSSWKDADGNHGVPSVKAYSDGDFNFDLSFFGGDWDGSYVVLCFCDEPLEPSALGKQSLDSLDSLAARVEALEAIVKHHKLGV